jgi:hypothetical protein
MINKKCFNNVTLMPGESERERGKVEKFRFEGFFYVIKMDKSDGCV